MSKQPRHLLYLLPELFCRYGSATDTFLIQTFRSMMQIVIGLSIDLKRCSSEATVGKWDLMCTTDFMTESLRIFSNPPVLMPAFAQYENHGQMKDYIQTFIRTCLVLSSTILRIRGLNTARQRKFIALLVDIRTFFFAF